MRITVVAVPYVEIADDDDAGLRSDALDEFSKLGTEGGERLELRLDDGGR